MRAELPRTSLEIGLESARFLIDRSVCEGTRSFYSRVWSEWECLLDAVEGSRQDLEGMVLYFIGSQFGAGMSPSGMSRRLSAMAFWFKARSLQDYTKTFLVKQAMRGFRRGQAVRDRRRPVSYSMLLALGAGLVSWCFGGYEELLFRAAFSLAFFGAFRISELVPPSRTRAGGLMDSDVCVQGDEVTCLVRRSKTDQLGKGVVVVLRRLVGSQMCPVGTLSAYLAVRPGAPGPLLVHEDGLFLSRFQFIQVFRKGLEMLGFRSGDFSSHSFRIGAATEAARWGLCPEAVKRIGRWESDRYKLYVRPHLL